MAVIDGLLALAATALAGSVAFLIGRRLGIVDEPGGTLKPHSRPVVPLGGAALIVGIHLTLGFTGNFEPALFLVSILAWGMGLVDDISGLSAVVRLLGAAAIGVVLVGVSDFPGGIEVAVVGLVATVVVINGINMIDGLDGLAGATSLVTVGALWWFAWDQWFVTPEVYVVVIGSIVGFLVWNWKPARLFLGDNGAYLLAVTLLWLGLRGSPDGPAGLVAVALIGVPLIELASTVLRRLRSRAELLSGDRDHTYDRMVGSGLSVPRAVLSIALAQAAWALLILLLALNVGDLVAAVTAVALGLLISGYVALRSRPVDEPAT